MWTPRFIRFATSSLYGLSVATFSSVLYDLSFNVTWPDSFEKRNGLSLCIPAGDVILKRSLLRLEQVVFVRLHISLQHEFYGAIDDLLKWDFGQGKWQ